MDSSTIKSRLAACGTDLTTLGSASDLINNTEALSSTNPAVQALITQLDFTEENARYLLITQGIDAVVTELQQLKSDMLASPPTQSTTAAPVAGSVTSPPVTTGSPVVVPPATTATPVAGSVASPQPGTPAAPPPASATTQPLPAPAAPPVASSAAAGSTGGGSSTAS